MALSELTGQNHHSEKLFMASCLGVIWLLMNCSWSPYQEVLASWKKAMSFIISSFSLPLTLRGYGMAITDLQTMR